MVGPAAAGNAGRRARGPRLLWLPETVGEPWSIARSPSSRSAKAKARCGHAAAHARHGGHTHDADEDAELVSRAQSGLGLFIGVVVYSAAFGGLFALAFAFAYGRMTRRLRGTAALLAALAFVALYLMPSLKYPANPPSVGGRNHRRTHRAVLCDDGGFACRDDRWLRCAAAGGAARALECDDRRRPAYLAIVALAAAILPAVDEVPQHFRRACCGNSASPRSAASW